MWPLRQHAVAKTTWPSPSPAFLYLSVLISCSYWPSGLLLLPPDSHYCGDYAFPSQVLLYIFYQFNPHPCPWNSTDSFGVSFLTLSKGSRGRGLWNSVYKVYTSVRWCPAPSHSLTTHSLTHPEQRPVPQAPSMVGALYRCTNFSLVHCIFTVPFLCLDMFM